MTNSNARKSTSRMSPADRGIAAAINDDASRSKATKAKHLQTIPPGLATRGGTEHWRVWSESGRLSWVVWSSPRDIETHGREQSGLPKVYHR